jgi:DNA polymerase (family X)
MPGIGPKTAARFLRELKIESPSGLLEAIDAGRLHGVAGFGAKKIENLRRAVEQAPKTTPGRLPLRAAWSIARTVAHAVASAAPLDQVEIAGSLRRRRESIGDVDILATSRDPVRAMNAFAALPGVQQVVLKGDTKCTVRYDPGIQVDLRVVAPEAFGAALQYFTGSKNHNVRLRTLARDQGLKINEYGVFRGEELVAGRTEEEVYRTLGLPWIPPEIRENQGELEAAAEGALPTLVSLADLRGELHQHLPVSFGSEEIDRLIRSANRLKLAYVGVVLPGKPAEPSWSRRLEELRAAWPKDGRTPVPQLLVGAEVSIEDDEAGGSAPEGAELVVLDGSSRTKGPPEVRGRRPPGRALRFAAHFSLGTDPAMVSGELGQAWIRWAVGTGSALEVSPDGPGGGLDASSVRKAVEAGVRVVVSAGSRSFGELDDLELAVGLARRGWAPPSSVTNADPKPAPDPKSSRNLPRKAARPRRGS